MHVSVQTPQQGSSFAALRDFWQAADGLGFAAAYTFDHLIPLRAFEGPGRAGEGDRSGGQLEGWLTVAGLATLTRQLRVGVLVSDVTLRPPALLAKMAITLDHLSDGRALLGLGAAWLADEFAMFGRVLAPAAERVARLAEALGVVRALWAARGDVDFDGRYDQLSAAYFEPASIQRPQVPIIVGGGGSRVVRLACQYADVLSSFGTPADWVVRNVSVDAQLELFGRQPRDLRRSAYVFADLAGRAEPPDGVALLPGDPPAAIAALRAYQDAGVDEVVLGLRPPYCADQLASFAADVVTGFAA